jgi:cold shock CspA family protein
MPGGTILKVVHLSLQSSFSTESSPQSKGYGYLQADGQTDEIYFVAKALKGYGFDDLQVGQRVEFEQDGQAPVAKSVTLSGAVLDPPSPHLPLG